MIFLPHSICKRTLNNKKYIDLLIKVLPNDEVYFIRT